MNGLELLNELKSQCCLIYSDHDKGINPDLALEEICLIVLSFFPGITLDDLKGSRRKREFIVPRQLCIFFVHEANKGTMSLKKIGHWFGGRDHSTVIHSKDAVQDQVDTDKVYCEMFNRVSIALKLSTHDK